MSSVNVIVEGLHKRFSDKGSAAVFNASFQAPAGGITTLLGPSGSGKTTILRIIAGLESADQGRVLVGGDDVINIPVQRRGFGFVFQGFALFNHMTVRENIAFGLRTRRAAQADITARVDELLQLVQLEDYDERYPTQLSGGQRQRVGLARALAARPEVLLLDEPFGALDTRVRIELREWLRQLHDATHLTTILVTHDQEEALDLSDQIVIVDGGRIQQVGTPEEVYESPATPFVASFIGVANVLRGQVKAGRASIGSLSLQAPAHIPDGASVRAIVRPHDIRILPRAHTNAPNGTTSAVVQRVVNLGAHVKLDLGLPNHDAVTVHVPRREFSDLSLQQGEKVVLDLNQARVFEDDYVI
jgi:sulfate/thiosulfate transport system ATP-binding protein